MQVLSRPIIILSIFFLVFPTLAQSSSVIINEIAWMGNKQSFNDEWIELYNLTNTPIDLERWILKAKDGIPEINLTGKIPASSYYLLERTDDTTVPGIEADLIYIGALENNGEGLVLYDNSDNLIDRVDCSLGWFAGDNTSKRTMEKKNPYLSGSDSDGWQTSLESNGTPKAENSITQITSPPEELTEEMESELLLQEKSEAFSYPSGILINEILPSPEGPDAKEEWIEIFNQNNFEVSLSGWRISDTVGKTTIFNLSEETKISPKGFLVLSRPTTKIILNNDGDRISFIKPNEKIIDAITYAKAPRGKSYNRNKEGWFWSSVLTPGEANVISPSESTAERVESFREEVKDSFKEVTEASLPKKELAAIGEQAPASLISFYVFLIPFLVAIFSGIIILILKRKLKEFDFKRKLE